MIDNHSYQSIPNQSSSVFNICLSNIGFHEWNEEMRGCMCMVIMEFIITLALQNQNIKSPIYIYPRPLIPQGLSVAKPGTLLLIILSFVCKFDIKEVLGNLSISFSKRNSTMDRNMLGRRVNAETVSHTSIIPYDMLMYHAYFSYSLYVRCNSRLLSTDQFSKEMFKSLCNCHALARQPSLEMQVLHIKSYMVVSSALMALCGGNPSAKLIKCMLSLAQY